jgi:hypothetical protein
LNINEHGVGTSANIYQQRDRSGRHVGSIARYSGELRPDMHTGATDDILIVSDRKKTDISAVAQKVG